MKQKLRAGVTGHLDPRTDIVIIRTVHLFGENRLQNEEENQKSLCREEAGADPPACE